MSLGPASQVLGEGARPTAPPQRAARVEAPRRGRRTFRFPAPLIAATVLTASLARAEGPGGGGMGLSEPAAEVVYEARVEPEREELSLTPRLGQVGQAGGVLGEVVFAKVDGTKDNPYVGKGLVKRVPRAKRIAWRSVDEGPQKVGDLKANPYE